MANKRNLKKYIRTSCGAAAVDMILARDAFPQIKRGDVYNIVAQAVALQQGSLSRVGINFDHAPKDFENKAIYNKERAKYFRQAYAKLLADFADGLDELVKKMNEALPEEVRKQIKEALAE